MEYPLMEKFYTLQGEGAYSGSAAYFIRLAGCDVGCVWCDVKDSWEAAKYPKMQIKEIIAEVPEQCTIVVITGGEPAMYDLTELCAALKAEGKRVHLETSGAYKIVGNIDWLCVSPKKFKAPLIENLNNADELKVVVFNKSDLKWAIENAVNTKHNCKYYLQPEWSVEDKMIPIIIDFVKETAKWQVSLQSHKYLKIP